MKSSRIKLSLPGRSYDIQVGAGAVTGIDRWYRPRSRRAFVISDKRLVKARKALLNTLRRAGWETHEIAVQAGEGLKDIESIYPLYGELLKQKADRDSTLFALGGGSVGDAAGFIAATYLRGIAWVSIPTTLLAQVDSGIGGKTGINHRSGKNLIGAFHQPSLVVCDTDFLKTLSRREIVSGFGEIIKYGLIYDPTFFRALRRDYDSLLDLDAKTLADAIRRSARWKSQAVQEDEFDRKGIREALNFGHTFGHALEAETGYRRYQHGEAVLWGMRFAIALSVVRGWMKPGRYREIDGFLKKIPLPPLPRKGKQSVKPLEIFRHMSKDKKIEKGKVRFVLLEDLGRVRSDREAGPKDLMDAFQMMTGKAERRA